MKIKLISMPFADVHRPSLSLTQIKSRINEIENVQCEIVYLNLHTARLFGPELYKAVSDQYISGLGDWLFRQIAFPNSTDNTNSYFTRFFPYNDPTSLQLKARLMELKGQLASHLDEMIEHYQLEDARIVGFSSMFSQNVASFALARRLKERKQGLITVMGGANCEYPMGWEIVRNVPVIDYVFSGPALISFPEFVGAVSRGDQKACSEIGGVFSKDNLECAETIARGGKDLPMDHPIPLDFDDFLEAFNQHFPEYKDEIELTFETSRGCWWGARSHCTFCGLNSQGMHYRAMSDETARNKLQEILTYADRVKRFSCVDNIMPQSFTQNVLPHLDVPADVSIFYELKASLSDEEIAGLARARITRVQPGIEALSTKTLRLMKKGTTALGNIRFLKSCRVHGVHPEWNLLIGFPGEEEAVYRRYLELLPALSHLVPPGGCFPVRFDRYSPYFNNPESFGLALTPYDFYEDVYPFPREDLRQFAYYFQDNNYGEYNRLMLRYIDQLRAGVQSWQEQHARGATLCWHTENQVLDTRMGQRIRHPLGPAEMEVLKFLETPQNRGRLAHALPGLENLEEIMARLVAQKLVIYEDNKALSLVLGGSANIGGQ